MSTPLPTKNGDKRPPTTRPIVRLDLFSSAIASRASKTWRRRGPVVCRTRTFWTRAFWRRIQMDDVMMKRAKTTLRDALCLPRCAGTSARSWPWSGPRRTRRRCSILCCSRERERESGEMLVCREKQISETRSRVQKSTCVFDHDDARFVSSGTKRTTPTTKRVLQKIETTRERRSKTGDDRSIDRSIDALLVIFTISFALTTRDHQRPKHSRIFRVLLFQKKRGRRRL